MEAAMKNVSKSVAQAISQARMDTINMVVDKVVLFIEDKIELDDELRAYFQEFRGKISEEIAKDDSAIMKAAKTTKTSAKALKATKTTAKDTKKTTKRSLYMNNLFVQDKMAELKAAGVKSDPEKGNLLKQANAIWREMSDEDKAAYTEANRERLAALNEARNTVVNAPVTAPTSEDAPREETPKEETPKEDAPKKEKAPKKTPKAPKTTKVTTEVTTTEVTTTEETPEKAIEKPTKEKKTTKKDASKAADAKFQLPWAERFMTMVKAANLPATEIADIKAALKQICDDLIFDAGSAEDVLSSDFADVLETYIDEHETLTSDEAYEVYDAFMQEMSPSTSNGNEEDEEAEEDDYY